MTETSKFSRTIMSAAAVLMLTASVPAVAQPAGPGGPGAPNAPGGPPPRAPERAPERGMVAPGMMMGPGMVGGPGMPGMCGPRAAGFAEWRIESMERAVSPTEAQRSAFEDLKTASTKAAEILRDACPADSPITPTARMAAMEKRAEAMLQAIKTVRPALDNFYGKLTDEQKARLNAIGPGGRGPRSDR